MKTGIFPQIIEKDLWATAVLQIVFSLPFADKLVFKGGTSLSKVWNLIERFSEDIDLSVHRDMFGLEGDLTVRQLKKLRKQSSLFVKEIFCAELRGALETFGIGHLCSVEAQPDGEGDKTYPEPRKIFARYHSLFDNMSYLKSEIVLETGARALIEPTGKRKIKSMISEHFNIDTAFVDSEIITALPEKTFSEKAFLLHELFTGDRLMLANRKSRHLYDLEKMMDTEFAKRAIVDNELWSAIHHHRQIFTRVAGVDYSRDIRPKIRLVPPPQVIGDWRQDYEKMQNTMIYGDSLSFAKLIRRIEELQERFMQQNIK
ncbi:MAG: nucleotidyl transferase AbiEii/AbiGii toxin family protein [Prevotellaceae bacterium]|jgi:predicted nucleotidyltransferase component of viral defense system|nr:nucleotidyl transferase AbiEii/AbiGii toxin family protein [Prevotellaceae bacterium]